MVQLYICIVFIVLNLLVVSECQLDSNEVNCVQNLGMYINDLRYTAANIGSTFCTSFAYSNCIDNRVNAIEIIQANSNLLSWSDFACLPSLNAIRGTNLKISSSFISNAPANLRRLDIVSSDVTTIDSQVPDFVYFSIGGLQGPIKSSYINNVYDLYVVPNSATPNYLEVDQTIASGNIIRIDISIKAVPNLSLFPSLKEAKLNILNDIDTNTFSNFLTFGALTTLALTNSDQNAVIPYPYALNEIQKPSFLRIEFRGVKFMKPSVYIDFSNMVNGGSIIFEGPGNDFNINGEMPIISLPNSKLNEFYIMDGYIPKIPDFNIFNNVSNLVLRNLQMEGVLPKIKSTMDFKDGADFSKNKITNSLDESWCGIMINLENNNILSIPDCYQCYLSDFRVNGFFSGNPNLFLVPVTCNTDTFIQPKFEVISGQSLIISGKNIGYYGDNIQTVPTMTFTRDSKNRFIADTKAITPGSKVQVSWTTPSMSYSITLEDSNPIIKGVVQHGSGISIDGSFFSYYSQEISVVVGSTECIVQLSTLEFISCNLPSPVKMDGSFGVVVNVGGKIGTSSIIIVNTACPVPLCNGNGLCDYNAMQCKCNSKYTTIGDKVCAVPNHYVSSYTQIPLGKNGTIQLNGWFGIGSDLTIKIGSNECKLEAGTQEIIRCFLPASLVGGIQQINITQNGLVWLGKIYPYFDPVVLCLNNCTSLTNGKCLSNGNCECNSGFKGLDCSGVIKSGNSSTGGIVDLPKTETNITSEGSIVLSNQESDFKISIDSINEIDISNTAVRSLPIGKWSFNSQEGRVSSFIQVLNNATLVLKIEEIDEDKDKDFQFAGNNFTVEAGGIKISISIDGWEYKSVLNTIQLVMTTDYQDNLLKPSNKCNEDNIKVKSSSNSKSISDSVNYLKVENKGKALFGRFQDKAISDEHNVFITTQMVNQNNQSDDNSKVYIGINLPHCSQCLIDPDFSVILSSDFKNECSDGSGRESWFLPVVIVVPIVGLVLIIIVSSILYRKNRSTIKIKLNNIKLRNL